MPRAQLYGALILFAVMLVTTGMLVFLAENQSLADCLMRTELANKRKTLARFSYEKYYIDFEDRLINDELPQADYSKGGVFLMGTSNLKWATRLWELPEPPRSLIHNYGMGSFNHGYQFQFLRYLVDHKGLLAAGGDKSMFIFGVSYHCVGTACDPMGFFPNLWTRHGLYSYSLSTGITPRQVSRLWQYLHFQRVRINGCLRKIASTLAHQSGWRTSVRKHNPALYNQQRQEWMGPDWEAKMSRQLSEFGAMLDYLSERQVRIAVVLLPQGSWEEKLPFARAYENKVAELCQAKAIPVHDLPNLIDDEHFADSNHYNLHGVDKMQNALVGLALPFLHSTAALP